MRDKIGRRQILVAVAGKVPDRDGTRIIADADISAAAKPARAIPQPNRDAVAATVGGCEILIAVVIEIADRDTERTYAGADNSGAAKAANTISQTDRDRVDANVRGRKILITVVIEIPDRDRPRSGAETHREVGRAAKTARAVAQTNGNRIIAIVSGCEILFAVIVEISDRDTHRSGTEARC